MLDSLTFTGRELLLAIILATLVYLLEAWLFSRRRRARGESRLDSRIQALAAELDGLAQRLDALERKGGAEVEEAGVYAEAVRLARNGLSAKEIAAQLGISLTEAELIIALKRAGP
jgi:hypothetical protein